MKKRWFKVPMRIPLRGVTERTGWVVQGESGWGECSPWPGMDRGRSEAAAIHAASFPFPAPVRDRVPVNVTVPAVAAEEASQLVRDSGCATAKVKVADGADEARVEAVRDALGPAGKLRIDANGRWDVDEAERMIRRLLPYGLEFVEQPVATIEELADLRRRIEVPIAADESVAGLEDVSRIVRSEAADIIVCKVQQAGGIDQALRMAEVSGLPMVVSSLIETSIGISAGVALAAALPDLPYACGLGTLSFLEQDITRDPIYPVDGAIVPSRPMVDEDALRCFEVQEGGA